jgi:hypothetical protein
MIKRPIGGSGTRKRVVFAWSDGRLFSAARWYGFLYGCVGTAFFFVLYVLALRGRFYGLPESGTAVLVIFCFHAVAGVVTFQPGYSQKWKPLFVVTLTRVRIARWALSTTSVQFAAFFLLLFVSVHGQQAFRDWLIPVILTSFLLQNTVYVACHWSLRPENFLPQRLIQAFKNPLGFVVTLFR